MASAPIGNELAIFEVAIFIAQIAPNFLPCSPVFVKPYSGLSGFYFLRHGNPLPFLRTIGTSLVRLEYKPLARRRLGMAKRRSRRDQLPLIVLDQRQLVLH